MIKLDIITANPELRLVVEPKTTEVGLSVEQGGNFMSSDYEKMRNKPQINGTELYKDTTLLDIGITEVSNEEIDDMFK